MTERTHWLGQDSTEQDSRLGIGALFASGSGLTVNPGVVSGLAVTQTGTASANVSVAAGVALNQASSAIGGAYLEILDTDKTVDVLGANPAESSPRRDLIVYDSGLAVGSKVHVVKGTAGAIPVDPAVPASATALARVRVKAAADYGGNEVIVNADIDTDVRASTGLRGVPVSVANQTARNALTLYPGLMVWRQDVLRFESYTGSAWRMYQPLASPGVQKGTVSATLTAATVRTGSVSFPTAYSTAPIMSTALVKAGTTNIGLTHVIEDLTTAGFSWRVNETSGTPVTVGLGLHWRAEPA